MTVMGSEHFCFYILIPPLKKKVKNFILQLIGINMNINQAGYLHIFFSLDFKEIRTFPGPLHVSRALGRVSDGLVGPSGLPALWGIELVSQERAGKQRERERKPALSNSPSFLPNSAGGLCLPPEAPGRGASGPSGPLVFPEQHDGERCPAWAWRERPRGGVPAVQGPPGTDGLPAAAPGCWPAKASPQNAPGTLRHRIPVRQPQPTSPTEGWHLTARQLAARAPFAWVTDGSETGSHYFLSYLIFMMEQSPGRLSLRVPDAHSIF